MEVRKISENRSIKGKVAVIVLLVIGIILIVVGFPLLNKPAYSYTELLGSNLLPIGVVITLFAIIGGIVVFIPKEDKEEKRRIIKGGLVLFIGIIILLIDTVISLIPSWKRSVYTRDAFILYIDTITIGIALILTGIFTIRPIQSRNGKIILGITSMIVGVIIIIIPLFHISIWWSNTFSGPMKGALGASSPFWLIGIIFVKHGISLVLRA